MIQFLVLVTAFFYFEVFFQWAFGAFRRKKEAEQNSVFVRDSKRNLAAVLESVKQSAVAVHGHRVHSAHPERTAELYGQDIRVKDGEHKAAQNRALIIFIADSGLCFLKFSLQGLVARDLHVVALLVLFLIKSIGSILMHHAGDHFRHHFHLL